MARSKCLYRLSDCGPANSPLPKAIWAGNWKRKPISHRLSRTNPLPHPAIRLRLRWDGNRIWLDRPPARRSQSRRNWGPLPTRPGPPPAARQHVQRPLAGATAPASGPRARSFGPRRALHPLTPVPSPPPPEGIQNILQTVKSACVPTVKTFL